ncbi:MAG: hydrogenase nickel incorporation protein HypA [Candidatus Thermoplasmatota archaeon]|nr:hydrogenase nickel incorporation protein HypA [Candidatus Thermoplasmatota archaeon]
MIRDVCMHEWALAESVIKSSIDAAEKENLKKITEINILLGALQQITDEIFRFNLDEIVKTYKDKFKDVKINIETEETQLQCKQCDHTWKFKDMKDAINDDEAEAIHFIPEMAFVHTRCPKCKSPDFRIAKGRGVTITSIKGVK